MSKTRKKSGGGFGQYVRMMFSSFPSLFLTMGRIFLRFKRDAKKAGRIFRRELKAQGIDKETAAALTETYLKSSEIRQYLSF